MASVSTHGEVQAAGRPCEAAMDHELCLNFGQAAEGGVTESLRYDLVNLGREAAAQSTGKRSGLVRPEAQEGKDRHPCDTALSPDMEVLAKVSNGFFVQMVNATTPAQAFRNLLSGSVPREPIQCCPQVT